MPPTTVIFVTVWLVFSLVFAVCTSLFGVFSVVSLDSLVIDISTIDPFPFGNCRPPSPPPPPFYREAQFCRTSGFSLDEFQ